MRLSKFLNYVKSRKKEPMINTQGQNREPEILCETQAVAHCDKLVRETLFVRENRVIVSQ